MPGSAPPPPRGTPGWQALADQFDAAARHARRVAIRMVVETGGSLVGPVLDDRAVGPWTDAILTSVQPDRCRGICEHLARGSRTRPQYVLAPRLLGCWDCLALVLGERAKRPDICERCGRTDQEVTVLVAQRACYIALGELCAACLAAEIPAV